MANLKERHDGEALVELGAQTRKGLVGEEDISLDLFRYLVDCAGVAEAERIPSCLEGSICVEDRIQEAIGLDGREGDGLRSIDLDGDCRLF